MTEAKQGETMASLPGRNWNAGAAPVGRPTRPSAAMTAGGTAAKPFSLHAFLDLAARRLARMPPGDNGLIGDFHLNPDFAPPPGFRARDAAVLVPIVAREGEAGVLLTRRTAHLSAHAGQIAFPGGKIDPADPSPLACAVREAEEEIGLAPELVQPIGFLDPYLTGTGFRIVPVVARVSAECRIAPNPFEVEAVFEVPLRFLMDSANHRQTSREFNGVTRHFYEMPFEEHYIWGATAGIIRALYERVYG